MHHVFLLVKDGFFHITNLALAKLETGNETSFSAATEFCCIHFVDHIKESFSSRHCSHWKNGCGSFERGTFLKSFSISERLLCFCFEHNKCNFECIFFSAPVPHQDRLLLHQGLSWRRLQHSSDVQSGPWNPLNDRGQCLRRVSFLYLSPTIIFDSSALLEYIHVLTQPDPFLPDQGDKESVLTHWTMNAHQAKMCLVNSIDCSLIPGKIRSHIFI